MVGQKRYEGIGIGILDYQQLAFGFFIMDMNQAMVAVKVDIIRIRPGKSRWEKERIIDLCFSEFRKTPYNPFG